MEYFKIKVPEKYKKDFLYRMGELKLQFMILGIQEFFMDKKEDSKKSIKEFIKNMYPEVCETSIEVLSEYVYCEIKGTPLYPPLRFVFKGGDYFSIEYAI